MKKGQATYLFRVSLSYEGGGGLDQLRPEP
jgi:hypothetical protein